MAAGPVPLAVVVAPDKFRGTLDAAGAAAAIAAGARDAAAAVGVPLDVRLRPVSDGGEGLVSAALGAGFAAHGRTVHGPTGDPVTATFALGADPVDSAPTAVVELAEASGLARVPGGRGDCETARTAGTYGTGELVRAALDAGVRRVVLGLGGSAGTDGGTGLAAALGARFLDAAGDDLPPGGAALQRLDRVDVTGLDPRLAGVELLAARDVDNPLTGERGAAAVYGPQKGATAEDVEALDNALRRLAAVLRRDVGVDTEALAGAGAAGGTGAGVAALLGGRLVPGVDVVLRLVGFADALRGAHLVVTGEGSLDAQTPAGKAPMGVARAAAAHGVPVLFLAGRVSLDAAGTAALDGLGAVGLHALTDLEPDATVAERDAAVLLRALASRTVGPLLPGLAGHPVTTDRRAGTTARSTA